MKKTLLSLFILIVATLSGKAQMMLSLEECRNLAIENNRELQIAKENTAMSEYDLKIARSNYLPTISAQGIWAYNPNDISLISNNDAAKLSSLGTVAQTGISSYLTQLVSDPLFLSALQGEPALATLLNGLSGVDISNAINGIGSELSNAFTIDADNIFVGMVTIQEPLYAGGKIRAYNKVAEYATMLAKSKYDIAYNEIVVSADEAYWQIVSIANKLKLAQQYHDLITTLNNDVQKMIAEGVATKADGLAVKVELNEAEMTLIKAQNGLALSKMLLCQLCGLDLSEKIVLEDEVGDKLIYQNMTPPQYSKEEIFENRPELKSLSIATSIYNQQINIARSDFLPTIALFGSYLATNPSFKNGIENSFGGQLNAGVMVSVPIFHWGEGSNKIKKAQRQVSIGQHELENAKEMVMLQVKQYEQQIAEADAQLEKSTTAVQNAEENLNVATLGFREGVITSSTVSAAQTAWLQAQSDYIDASINRIMAIIYLQKAVGIM